MLLCAVWLLASCRHAPPRRGDATICGAVERGLDGRDAIKFLNSLTDAYYRGCDDVLLSYGPWARERYGHKVYSLSRETANVFLPDGTLTAYTLESYERGFLTILLAYSYANKGKDDDARVELRRLDQELFTRGYNYGEDPANLILSAVLWERVGDLDEARVDWLRLRDASGALNGLDGAIRSFAGRQVERIDRGAPSLPPFRVYGAGLFPGVAWQVRGHIARGNFYRAVASPDFPAACQSETGVRVPTRHWFDKLAARYNAGYHPLQNVQSWLRLSVGTIYSVVPAVAGAGVAAGGCALGAVAAVKTHAGTGGLNICEDSVAVGGALMGQAPRVWRGVLRPDFRHWSYVPSSFVITSAPELLDEACAKDLPQQDLLQAAEL